MLAELIGWWSASAVEVLTEPLGASGRDSLLFTHNPLHQRGRSVLDTDWSRLYCSDMNDSIVKAMILAARRVEERLEAELAEVGLSGAKFGALDVLVDEGKPIILSELAAKLTCVRSNITQLVDRLEADGLVKRTDDPADRRAVYAEVSALGRKRHAAGAKVVNAVYQAVARELSPLDLQALKGALNSVR